MKTLWKRLKALYRRTSLREKLLTLAFVLVIIFLWANNWANRLSDWNSRRTSIANELEFQRQTLERAPEIAEGLERALARVDPSKTYDGSRLPGRVEEHIRSAGLSAQADINTVRTKEGEIFNDHNLRVELERISIGELIKFNALLKEDTPYINLQSVRIAARRNPEELNVRFEINSFDLQEDL